MVKRDDNIYAPAPDPESFDARYDADENRGPLLLVVAFAVLLAFAAVVYTAYHQGLRKGGRNAAPHVSAAAGPIKVRPDEPHGTPTPNLGNKAYEPLDGIKAVPSTKVKTAPLPEKPLPRPAQGNTAPPAVTPAPAPAVPKARPKPRPAPVRSKPKPAPVKAKPRPVPKPTATSGAFRVQIAAFRSEDQALAAWAAMQGRWPKVMAGRRANVQRADLGARGVYYRLRAASFADRAAASAWCAALKTKGQNCIVVSH